MLAALARTLFLIDMPAHRIGSYFECEGALMRTWQIAGRAPLETSMRMDLPSAAVYRIIASEQIQAVGGRQGLRFSEAASSQWCLTPTPAARII